MRSKSKTTSLSPAGQARKTETEDRYRALLKRRAGTGATLRAFAETVGIPVGTLAWWTHELRRRDQLRGATPARVNVPTFLPVKITVDEPRAPVSRAPYEVVLGGDRVLRVPACFDAATLTALVRAVEAASC